MLKCNFEKTPLDLDNVTEILANNRTERKNRNVDIYSASGKNIIQAYLKNELSVSSCISQQEIKIKTRWIACICHRV